MAIVDVCCYPGNTYVAKLFALPNLETPVESLLATTELTNCKGHYRFSVTGRTGWHLVQMIPDGAEAPEAEWAVELKNDNGVYFGQDLDYALWQRTFNTSISDIILPIPVTNQTIAYAVCRDAEGAAQTGVVVHLAAIRVVPPSTGGNIWSSEVQTRTSNSNGVVFFTIPRDTSLSFKVWRASGNSKTFSGEDIDYLPLPDLLG